jgi:hypothetical protein
VEFVADFMTASQGVTTVYDMYNSDRYLESGINAGILTSQIGFLCFAEYLKQQQSVREYEIHKCYTDPNYCDENGNPIDYSSQSEEASGDSDLPYSGGGEAGVNDSPVATNDMNVADINEFFHHYSYDA